MLNEIEKLYAYLQFRQAGMDQDEAMQAIGDLEFLILMDQLKSIFDEVQEEIEEESEASEIEDLLKTIFS